MARKWYAGRRVRGLKTDTKPSAPETNTSFEETDTGNTYKFDGTNWKFAGAGTMVSTETKPAQAETPTERPQRQSPAPTRRVPAPSTVLHQAAWSWNKYSTIPDIGQRGRPLCKARAGIVAAVIHPEAPTTIY